MIQSPWNLSSRIHPLHSFPDTVTTCYVKRDDELGSGISGTKLRKYSSLVPFLIAQQYSRLIIIAGPQSNNLLAALQIARELQLQVTVCLLKPKHTTVHGNFKLSRLFLTEQEIVWIDRSDWTKVDTIAQKLSNSYPDKTFILAEGASVLPAWSGAMSLGDDIIRNEKEMTILFDHVFIDAGTGFSAAALINRMHQLCHRVTIHVLLLADKKETFQAKLLNWVGFNPANYLSFYPTTAKSFGAINHRVKTEIKLMAFQEGILADPIYAAKLFYASRHRIVEENLTGNILIIHSGGTLTMPGFDY